MSKNNKKPVAIYAILGAGSGLIVGLIYNNLALSLIFGFAIGFIIDSIIYINNKRT